MRLLGYDYRNISPGDLGPWEVYALLGGSTATGDEQFEAREHIATTLHRHEAQLVANALNVSLVATPAEHGPASSGRVVGPAAPRPVIVEALCMEPRCCYRSTGTVLGVREMAIRHARLSGHAMTTEEVEAGPDCHSIRRC